MTTRDDPRYRSDVDNQHRRITGYRELDEREVRAMNLIKDVAREVAELYLQVRDDVPDVDERALRIARTQLQDGFMWFVRAVARPEDPFDR